MALLSLCYDLPSAVRFLSEAVGNEEPHDAELTFEYQVPVQGGKGTASHTDLMIITQNTGIAVEAKQTEPKYASVGK